ncbi:MAG: hypothetical protein IKO21_03715 [Fibrobacter sp.]|nr:hypothetical protein [Fibrobacter sp.]
MLLALLAGSIFTGCSDDEQDFYTLKVGHPNDISESTFKTLKCTKSLEGEYVYIIETEQIYECDNKKWVELFVSSSSENSSSSSDEDEESSSSDDLDIIVVPSSSSYIFDIDEESSSSEEIEESSSSEEEEESSSSEEAVSSSSSFNFITKVKPCRNAEIDTCQYGVLEDERDGQKYKTVVIGEQTWMAQNLNYDIEDNRRQSCYRDEPDFCLRFGKLYSWPGVMDYDKNRCQDDASCSLTSNQGICPNGWHVPTKSEWDTLWSNVGFTSENLENGDEYGRTAVRGLISDTSYITWDRSGKSDFFGFSATRHGYKTDVGDYVWMDNIVAAYWTSSEVYGYGYKAYVAGTFLIKNVFDDYAKVGQFAVRCIKNPEENNDE